MVVRLMKRGALATVVLGALALGVAAPASAAQSWWHLGTSSRPTNMWEPSAVNGRDEVQVVNGSASGLAAVFVDRGSTLVGCMGSECSKYGLPDIKTAGELQAALEAPAVYGAGNVEVSGGPLGVKPFLITSIGADAQTAVTPIEVAGSATAFVATAAIPPNSGRLVITATNLGDASVVGSPTPVTITDTLPEGVTALAAEGMSGSSGGTPTALHCSLPSSEEAQCTFGETLLPYESIEIEVIVALQGSPPVAGNPGRVVISGGKAPSIAATQSVHVSDEPTPFGVESYGFTPENEGGTIDTQAGSHPFQLTTTVDLNQGRIVETGFTNGHVGGQGAEPSYEKVEEQPGVPRNFRFDLPAGLVGDAQAVTQCSDATFAAIFNSLSEACPASSAVGVAAVTIIEHAAVGLRTVPVPVFNLVPAEGEPARFGFLVAGVPVFLDTGVRTGEGYGVTVSVDNTTEAAELLASTVTLWGVPGLAAHDNSRGWACFVAAGASCTRPAELGEKPFLRLPTSCGTALQTPMELEPWNVPLGSAISRQNPGEGAFGALDGCNQVPFTPHIEVAPDVQSAATPSGLTVHVRVPNETVLTPNGISEGDVKNTTVALPAGVTLNPGGADKLEGCSEQQIGFQGTANKEGMLQFTGAQASCPSGSKIATVAISSPLLPNPLTGSVYLASPAPDGEAGQNPLNALVGMYIVAKDPVSGVLVKLPGKTVPCETAGETIAGKSCEAPGQLISTFEDTPQLPFEDLEMHFFGGSRAPLATPNMCGKYTTSAMFESWSGAKVASTSFFEVTHGVNEGACPSSEPFAPDFNTESVDTQAGEYSELRTTMGHPDGNQPLGALKLTLPPGLMGSLAHVKLCGEPQASQGTCGPESLIGHTVVTAGLGSDPIVVKRPGSVYITTGYGGAPYGLSIANPAEAGPFDLEKGTPCDCVVVRAKVNVDPRTAQLSVQSDPLPTAIKGVPLDIQHVTVQIDRPQFTFNPTSCEKMSVQGTLSSSDGATVPVSTPFQVANCANLEFAPKFNVTTSGHTSRANGASLDVKLSFPNAPFGTQANVKSVHVELPKALPSRLSTLNHACPDSVFDQNPAGCSAQSRVGYAKAITPVLPVPLEGPAYFVSHGGQKFPELIMVLQGYGVTIELAGETFISKTGITSSTFKQVPDVPVSSFELTLPEGKYSALAANRNLCTTSLTMPTKFTGQNGALLEQKTKITVTGCKPTIRVLRHRVRGSRVTLTIHTPLAGRLTARGLGLRPVHRSVRKAGNVTITLKLTKKEQAVLRHHRGRRLRTKIKLLLAPRRGKRIAGSVTVLVG